MLNTDASAVCADRLKRATRKAHQETEAALVPRLKGIKSREDYAAVLRMFYGFFHPLEEKIVKQIGAHLLPDIGERRKSGWILRDLEQLGLPAAIVPCPHVPAITNHLQAFGALYVLEGSTLGGTVITKMLQANPHLSIPEGALTFFRGYGNATATLWARFRGHLNASVHTEEEKEQAEAAANDTFHTLRQWILVSGG